MVYLTPHHTAYCGDYYNMDDNNTKMLKHELCSPYISKLLSNFAAFMTFTDWLNRRTVPVNATFTVWPSINGDGLDYMSNNQIANHSAPCSRSVASTCRCRPQYVFRTKQLESRNDKFYKNYSPSLSPTPFQNTWDCGNYFVTPARNAQRDCSGIFPLLRPRGPSILQSQLPMLFLK